MDHFNDKNGHSFACRCCGGAGWSSDKETNVCLTCYLDLGVWQMPSAEELGELALLAQMELPGPLLPMAPRGRNLNQMHD